MHRRSFEWRVACLLALGCAAGAAPSAQPAAAAPQDVIAGRALTSDAVLDALDPAAVRERSLRISATGINAAGRPVAPAAPRASASLLITFDTASFELTPAARRQLDIVASALLNDRLAQYRFTVEGHADPRGAAETNLQLSQQRADSVKRYLVATHRIAEDRLQAEGRGESEPMLPAQPTAPENRRVTFVTQVK
jgi:outer membrane protein OmpA-like peptidoglycan-associated protein